MRTIFKFQIDPGMQTIPAKRVVHVGVDPTGDPAAPCVWAEVDTERACAVDVIAHGTGHPVPHSLGHVGSVVTPVGFVWHVFSGPNHRSEAAATDQPGAPS